MRVWGWPRGRVVKFARSAAAGGPVFRWFESWARTWHCSSNHAEAASHMPQLERTHNEEYTTMYRGALGRKRKKKKNKILKKKQKTDESLGKWGRTLCPAPPPQSIRVHCCYDQGRERGSPLLCNSASGLLASCLRIYLSSSSMPFPVFQYRLDIKGVTDFTAR